MPKPTADPRRGATAPTLRRWWSRLRAPVLAVAGAVAVLTSASAVWGINIYLAIDRGRPPPVELPTLDIEPELGDRPRNVLILGSDTREGLTEEEQALSGGPEDVEGERSDTIILMHLDPRREKAVVVHFPRDLLVRIPGHGMDRINAAYEAGGPSLTVDTVKRFTGLPIHHYVEVDFVGFQRLVDVMGGVRICVDRPMHDQKAGLDIPRAGCHVLDAHMALAFVRARNVEGDLIPDFSRIRRQQQFMRAMMNRLLSVGSLLDEEVIRAAARNVTTDSGLSTADLLLLGGKLRELAEEDPTGATSLDFRVVPSQPRDIDGASYVVALRPQARRMFEALAAGRPLGNLGVSLAQTLPSPAVIRVRVLSAGDPDDVGHAEAVLRRAGFVVLPSASAPPGEGETAILYRPGARGRAEVVGGYFSGLPRREVPAELMEGAEVALVVGPEYAGVTG